MTTPTDTGPDPEAVKRYAFQVWTYKLGEKVSLMIHLGDRLGLYRALEGSGPTTPEELADRTGLNPRLVREWLMGQAAARLIDSEDGEQFELTDVGAAVLADEANSVDFAGGAFQGGIAPDIIDRLAESFTTGVGLTYEEQGIAAAAGMARMNAPRFRLALASEVVPAIDGLKAALDEGIAVAEIGCGAGVALQAMAEAFPRSRFIGIDPSTTAVTMGRQRTQSVGVDNIDFHEGYATDIGNLGEIFDTGDAGLGLVMAFDCLHDMPHPDRAVSAISNALADDGVFLVKEIRCSGDFDLDRRNPMLPLLYGYSITSCLQSALSEPDGMALGTLGLHPERLADLVTANGFATVVNHDLGEPNNLYYEVRK